MEKAKKETQLDRIEKKLDEQGKLIASLGKIVLEIKNKSVSRGGGLI